jgi:putative transposase
VGGDSGADWRRLGHVGLDDHGSDLVCASMALGQRCPGADLSHHSDQGRQYTGGRYQDVPQAHGIPPSTNSVGSWYDNAPTESHFGTLKRERVHHRVYQTRHEAGPDLFYFIEGFYNRNRLLRRWAISARWPTSACTPNQPALLYSLSSKPREGPFYLHFLDIQALALERSWS